MADPRSRSPSGVIRPTATPHGRSVAGGEPLVFHCNFYNYWLQKTVLLPPGIDMAGAIVDAAEAAAFPMLERGAGELGATTPSERGALAEAQFSLQGFGTLDLSGVGPEGGVARTPTSHYGQALTEARDHRAVGFDHPQNLFDQGYAAAAAAAKHGLPMGSFRVTGGSCMSRGAPIGEIVLERCATRPLPASPGQGRHVAEVTPGPPASSGIDEPAVLSALSGLDLSGNEEGLVPRFGVFLTDHFANFYNQVSFEFTRRMAGTGLRQEAEELLVDAGFRCAFNTFGGIMTSAEWDAVVRPMIRGEDDWVHGMVAVVNTLGWGVWRVMELEPDRIVVRIYDDYESAGWHATYGPTTDPVCWLHLGGVAGLMNLVRIGRIMERPTLDHAFYERCFEAERAFVPRCTKSLAAGHPWTEIEAVRR